MGVAEAHPIYHHHLDKRLLCVRWLLTKLITGLVLVSQTLDVEFDINASIKCATEQRH